MLSEDGPGKRGTIKQTSGRKLVHLALSAESHVYPWHITGRVLRRAPPTADKHTAHARHLSLQIAVASSAACVYGQLSGMLFTSAFSLTARVLVTGLLLRTSRARIAGAHGL
jgi:hypothetical protein